MLKISQPNGDAIASLLVRLGRRYQVAWPKAPAHSAAPGGSVTIVRLNGEGPVFQEALWSRPAPLHKIGSGRVLNGCLVPATAVRSQTDGVLRPLHATPVMMLGAVARLTATGVSDVSLAIIGAADGSLAPVIIPEPYWLDWLQPDRDIRELERLVGRQWSVGPNPVH